MNNRPKSRSISLVSKVLIGLLISSACLVGVLSYGVLGRGQGIQPRVRNTAEEIARLTADARTVLSAISYILDPELDLPVQSSRYGFTVKETSFIQPG